MSVKRVQKLLFSEYCDFEDMVLIESPFAQTTSDGNGLRQVHLGLTPSKLVLATDVLPPVEHASVKYLPGIDPDIETFELIAIYPIECVNLSVYRRNKRQALKAHFCNNRVYYFELGGFENRSMLWNLWCEKIKFLSPEIGSSNSETSVATSSTNSTLYLLESRQVEKANGFKQLWCKFGTSGKSSEMLAPKWTDRCLFLGNSDHNYLPLMQAPRMSEFLHPKSTKHHQRRSLILANDVKIGDCYQINRFEEGVKEGCSRPLFLPAENYIVPRRFSLLSEQSSGDVFGECYSPPNEEEACVRAWEHRKHRRSHHRRRYGFAPQPLFLHGLGPWKVSAGSHFSVQIKRAVSLVTIRKQPIEPEMRLPVTKRQLVATISCEAIRNERVTADGVHNQNCYCGPRRPVVIFWTPNYWYRPRSAREAYIELHEHLAKIQKYHQKVRKKRRLFRRRVVQPKFDTSDSDDSDNKVTKPVSARSAKKKKKLATKFNTSAITNKTEANYLCEKKATETFVQYLKRLLKINVVLTAWDFDSTTLAQQLTMIDRDLFLKITTIELAILVRQQCSKNAPNVGALIAFSHRISCLVATDILKNECERMRARMISRFINVAHKCHLISNYQTCRTILFGLQSPGIYRLHRTWAYVRKKHATKYETFEFLSRVYKDPRLRTYQKSFLISTQEKPYMPYIGDIFGKLLDRIPSYRNLGSNSKTMNGGMGDAHSKSDSLFTKLLMSMKLLNFHQESSECCIGEIITKQKGLCDYYKPLNISEDNREKCLAAASEFLQKCQLSALHYNFQTNDIALDYLLKARYKEEKDNFFKSLSIESLDNKKR